MFRPMYRKFKPPFFCSEQYRRTGESSIPFLFDENPGVAFAIGGSVSYQAFRIALLSKLARKLRIQLRSDPQPGAALALGQRPGTRKLLEELDRLCIARNLSDNFLQSVGVHRAWIFTGHFLVIPLEIGVVFSHHFYRTLSGCRGPR